MRCFHGGRQPSLPPPQRICHVNKSATGSANRSHALHQLHLMASHAPTYIEGAPSLRIPLQQFLLSYKGFQLIRACQDICVGVSLVEGRGVAQPHDVYV